MKTIQRQQSFPDMVQFFRDMIRFFGTMTFPRPLVPAPVSARRQVACGVTRRTASSRPISWLPLLVGLLLLAAVPARAGQAVLPAGVPNIFDSEVQAQFRPVGVANLRGNSDLPVVLLVNTTDEQPRAMLLGLDARNEKDTWSLSEDPIILIMVFRDPTTIKALYMDAGFAAQGKASGNYTEMDEVSAANLPDLLEAITAAVTRTYL